MPKKKRKRTATQTGVSNYLKRKDTVHAELKSGKAAVPAYKKRGSVWSRWKKRKEAFQKAARASKKRKK